MTPEQIYNVFYYRLDSIGKIQLDALKPEIIAILNQKPITGDKP